MKKIPFIDLKTQQDHIRPQLDERIRAILDKGDYIMGEQVDELEESLCDFSGAKYCISCSSGSDALLMALMAWGIGPGDAVFVPAFTFFASAEMPALLGATPIFVDIDPRTFLMDIKHLEESIIKVLKKGELRPKVIMPVDLFGQAAEYERILPLAHKYGLKVLEDGAQAFGASRFGKKVCALGCDAAATSFFPAKPLGCYGDGGAIFTDDPNLAETLRSIRVHGKGADKYENIRIGINGRMDTLQAAVLLAKLEIFADEIRLREQAARAYADKMAELPELLPPFVLPNSTSVYAQYSVLAPEGKRDVIMSGLARRNVPVHVYYPKPLPFLPVFSEYGYREEDFPVSSMTAQRIFALPFHPYLDEESVNYICRSLKESLNDIH